MINNRFLTGFVLRILIVACLTLLVYSSEVCGAGGSPDDAAEFMSEMNEFLRHPDEPDIYPDDYLNTSDSLTATQNNTSIPYYVNENVEISSPQPSKNRETWIALPSDPDPEPDPESEYPAEPETLTNKFIDVIEELLESDFAVVAIAGVVVIFVIAGLGIMIIRKKTTTASFQASGSRHLDQESVKCRQCAMVISANQNFCPGCGEKI